MSDNSLLRDETILSGRAPPLVGWRGGTLRPFAPGVSGNPGGKGNPLKEVQRLARKMSKPSIGALAKIVNEFNAPDQDEHGNAIAKVDHDPRVAIVAAQTLLTWAFGKPPDYNPDEERQSVVVDLANLTGEQLALLRAMINSGAIRPSDAPTVPDADVVESVTVEKAE